jgi:hypothetical protein
MSSSSLCKRAGLQIGWHKSVHKLWTTWRSHCSFLVVATSLMALQDILTCSKVVLTSLIQSWYNKNVTRLVMQGCNNIVISWLYRTCWNNLAIQVWQYQQGCYKLLTTCSKLGLVDGLLADLLQDVRCYKISCWPYWKIPLLSCTSQLLVGKTRKGLILNGMTLTYVVCVSG